MHHLTIYNIFKPYCNKADGEYGYKKYLNALVALNLLVVDESYVVGDNESIEGSCKKYLLSMNAIQLLSNSNVEYLKALHENKDVIRRNNDAVRKRMSRKETYSDYVLNYIQDGLNNFEYDCGKAMAVISGSNWTSETVQSAESSLITFKTKDFNALNYNAIDGRVFNEFVAMISDLRNSFQNTKSMERKAVIDIRCCHPTFFQFLSLSDFL